METYLSQKYIGEEKNYAFQEKVGEKTKFILYFNCILVCFFREVNQVMMFSQDHLLQPIKVNFVA
jgi:hypothetical protein